MIILFCILFVICPSVIWAKSYIVEGESQSIHYHLRILPQRFNQASFEIRWNKVDSLSFSFARITTYGQGLETSNPIKVEIGSSSPIATQISTSQTFIDPNDPQEIGLSAVLDVSTAGAILSVGVAKPIAEIPVPFTVQVGSTIEGIVLKNAQITRDEFTASFIPPAELSSFGSIDQLIEYIQNSTNPYEGFWTYYDRVTTPGISSIGGYYTIATVASGSNYSIIYISGAQSLAHNWQPLQIKGSLTPATFPGAFNLTWIQPSLIPLSYETSATIDGDLLTLSFPHWHTSLRFRRILPAQIPNL